MSKKNNVNPDHYKTAGRERQGEDIVHGLYKRQFTQSKSQAGERHPKYIPGAQRAAKSSEEESQSEATARKAGKGKA
jgi:hypothetical protein